MVDRPGSVEAARLAARHPQLSVGLHFEAPEGFAAADAAAAESELERQLGRFRALLGRSPTHLDSHHHAHRAPPLREAFSALGARLAVPVRGCSPVLYIGGFYAQWEWEVTDLHHVSVEFLEQILRTELVAEWTELGCHPGYVSEGFQSVYHAEREAELATLTDPRLRSLLAELEIELSSYADYAAGVPPQARARPD
jgi:predicted glycoside hydrolase/deacetylase ChbG (UPF0249 family)